MASRVLAVALSLIATTTAAQDAVATKQAEIQAKVAANTDRTAELAPFYVFILASSDTSDEGSADGDFKGKCIGAVFNDNNVATGEIKFIDCDGTDGQMWQPISGGVQWRNKATLTCMTTGTDNKAPITLTTCDASGKAPAQQFYPNALINRGGSTPICGGQCEGSDGLCGFVDNGDLDWCENVGVIHNNTQVTTERFCQSPVGAGNWKALTTNGCSKKCGGGTTTITYTCESVLGFENACCGPLPPATRTCNSFPCSANPRNGTVAIATAEAGDQNEGKCLTAINGDQYEFATCNGWSTQLFFPIKAASPNRRHWVNFATGNCLTTPKIFTGTDKDRLVGEPCTLGSKQQEFDARGPFVDSRNGVCPAPCADDNSGACAFRDTDAGSATWCKAGVGSTGRLNGKVSTGRWCEQSQSEGEYQPIGESQCSVTCGGGVLQASGFKCVLKSNPQSTGTACCKGKKPTAGTAACNPQPCGRPGTR